MRDPGDPRPERLVTFWSIGWVLLLAAIASGAIVWLVSVQMAATKRARVGDGATLESYRFDLSRPAIDLAELQPVKWRNFVEAIDEEGGLKVDEVLESPEKWLRKLLVPSDPVIGVAIGGEARAYPIRVLNFHEVVNDVVGGVPVAVAYHPLTDAAMVFDRRLNGETVRFRASGFLYRSAQVLYEEREEIGTESLWLPLRSRAVAGPLAGQPLEVLSFVYTTFGEWRAAHPDTTIVRPDPRFHEHYPRRPYAQYFGARLLRHPVKGYDEEMPEAAEERAWSPMVLAEGGEEPRWMDAADLPEGTLVPIRARALRWAVEFVAEAAR